MSAAHHTFQSLTPLRQRKRHAHITHKPANPTQPPKPHPCASRNPPELHGRRGCCHQRPCKCSAPAGHRTCSCHHSPYTCFSALGTENTITHPSAHTHFHTHPHEPPHHYPHSLRNHTYNLEHTLSPSHPSTPLPPFNTCSSHHTKAHRVKS